MKTSTVSNIDPGLSQDIHTVRTGALPPPHPAEAGTFARQLDVPGHRQEALSGARVVLAGAGGLNSWVALGLLRSGVQQLTIVDPDVVERTNLPRQLYFGADLGRFKAPRLAENLGAHALGEATITGLAMPFEEAVERCVLPADLLVVGVDRNDCRLAAVRWARARGIPAVFTMLSRDSLRCQAFLQGPEPADPCLWCALPDLDPENSMPCAAAVISSCFLAGGFTLFFAHRALMGWPQPELAFNWREADLAGIAPDRTGMVKRRPGCLACGDRTPAPALEPQPAEHFSI